MAARSFAGFTFMECLVAVIALTVGMVVVVKAFLFTLDTQQYVIHRMYAQQLLSDQIDRIRADYEHDGQVAPGRLSKVYPVEILNRRVEFVFEGTVNAIFKGLTNLEELQLNISWQERGRRVQVPRKIYLFHKSTKEE